MYRLYQKVNKSDKFPYGMRKLEENENPFIEGTCLLVTLEDNKNDKDTNESINRILEFAKVRDYLSHENKVDLDKFPVKFLGLDYGEKEDETGSSRIERPYKEGTREFTEKYLLPLVSENGERLAYFDAIKNLRSVNIIPFGKSAESTLELIETLSSNMTKLKYTKDEIKNLLMQICVFPIETDISNMKKFRSTTLGFLDSNDSKAISYKDPYMGERAERIYAIDLTNSGIVQVNGDGSHDFNTVYNQGRAFPAMISSAVIRALDNSIKRLSVFGSQSMSLDYITAEFMDFLDMSEANKSREVILKRVKDIEVPQNNNSMRKMPDGPLFNYER